MITIAAIIAFIALLAVAIGKGIKKAQRPIKEEPKEPVRDDFHWYKDIWP